MNKTINNIIRENKISVTYCLKNIPYMEKECEKVKIKDAKSIENLFLNILKEAKVKRKNDKMLAERLIEHKALSLTPKTE
ncbi:MAG: hypothetical protein ACI37Z_09910 [Candidatus Gastranaerophilaceae bacterium]